MGSRYPIRETIAVAVQKSGSERAPNHQGLPNALPQNGARSAPALCKRLSEVPRSSVLVDTFKTSL